MGYRYLDRVASAENIRSFLELVDLAAGAGSSADNVFQLSHRLRDSKPMQLCQRRLARDPASAALIAARHCAPPYDSQALRSLPKGSLGHTYATVLGAMNTTSTSSPSPRSSPIWPATPITSTTASTPPTTCTTSSAASASTTSVSWG